MIQKYFLYDCYHLGQQLCILSNFNHKWIRLYSSDKQDHPNITLIDIANCEASLIHSFRKFLMISRRRNRKYLQPIQTFSSAQLRYISCYIFFSYVSVLSMSNRTFEVSGVIYTQTDIIILELPLVEIGLLKEKLKIQKFIQSHEEDY